MHYDVGIIGAGVVGLSSALAMASAGLDVVIFDNKAIQEKPLGDKPNLRVYAVNCASKALFEQLHVWDLILQQRLCAYQSMQVWDQASRGEINFNCQEVVRSELGYIIEEQVLLNALIEKTHSQPKITLIDNTELVALEQSDEACQVISKHNSVACSLVLGCDGANSWVRETLEIPLNQRAYGHHAIVCSVQTEKPHHHTARQIFTPDGPLAFLPLYDKQQCSIVWSTNQAQAERLLALDNNTFCQQLASAFEHRLGEVVSASPRVSFPLQMRHVKRYSEGRVVLLGDAAHTIHPLAGQGANLGLMDVATLWQCVVDNKKQFSEQRVLRRYERARKGEIVAAIAAMDGLKHFFSPRAPLPLALKSFGIELTNAFSPLKRQLIKRAMGLSRNRPDIIKQIN